MELRNIQTFLKITELNSFSKAAEELQYAQSTVTMQMKQLEKELGFPLFDRIGKKVDLTEKGLRFRNYSYQICRLAEQAKGLAHEDVKPSGKLRIGVIESICAFRLGPILRKYAHDYPDVSVSVITACTSSLLNMLNHNQVDIIYTTSPNVMGPDYICPLVEPEPVCFIAAPTFHPEETTTLKELVHYPLILTEETCSYRQYFDKALSEQHLNVQPAIELSNTRLILDLTRDGSGIALLPKFAAQQDIEDGTLNFVPVEDFQLTLYRQLIYRKDKWLNLQMKTFIETAQDINAIDEQCKECRR